MRRLLIAFPILLVVALFGASFALAGEDPDKPYDEPYNGAVVCVPERFYKRPAGECLSLGPTAYLKRMASIGITFPLRPFPGKAPDPSLTYIDIHYGEVVQLNAPVYASLEDAAKRKSILRRIDSPYSFISYTDEAVVDGRRFYMVDWGGWMTANEVSRIGAPSYFQGLVFDYTPRQPFGWILYPIQTKRTPGFEVEDYTGHDLYRYEVVQVYDAKSIDGTEWYMVAPDEWIPERQDYQRFLGKVTPNTTPPEGADNGRWIEINLNEQTVAVYDQRRLVFATLTSTGIEPFWTRPGLFKIYQKLNTTPMRGSFEADHSDAYYLEDVPWTMYFDKARALHGAYWHNGFGSVRSHGCVNLSVGDAHWLFNWAEEGDWVYVWDPSGKTPTDPSFYGEGGA
jgi:lipoprotein-anchoring transpeptidase ErfK/SrfK